MRDSPGTVNSSRCQPSTGVKGTFDGVGGPKAGSPPRTWLTARICRITVHRVPLPHQLPCIRSEPQAEAFRRVVSSPCSGSWSKNMPWVRAVFRGVAGCAGLGGSRYWTAATARSTALRTSAVTPARSRTSDTSGSTRATTSWLSSCAEGPVYSSTARNASRCRATTTATSLISSSARSSVRFRRAVEPCSSLGRRACQ